MSSTRSTPSSSANVPEEAPEATTGHNNTGQMLSIAIVFPLALSKLPFGAVQQVFITGGGMGSFASIIPVFLSGLHEAFLFSFILSVIAAVVAALRPSHGTRLLGEEEAA